MSGQSSRYSSSVTVCVMRHGMAQQSASQDNLRELVDFGQQQAWDTASWLTKFKPQLVFDMALVSPYVRAQQTFDIVKQHFVIKEERCSEMITPLSNAELTHNYLVGLLHENTHREVQSILIVSHMPFVSLFLGELLHSGNGELFNTGAMAVVDCDRDTLKGKLIRHYQSIM